MSPYYVVAVYALLLFSGHCPVVSEDSCQINQSCTAVFVHSNIEFVGCPVIPLNFLPSPTESLNCLSSTNCKALTCGSTTSCTPCKGSQIQSITFNSSGIYLKRAVVMLNRIYDQTKLGKEAKIVPQNGLMAGDLIYVRATLMKYDNFFVELHTRNNQMNFHMKARCNPTCANTFNCTTSQCSSKYLVMTSYVNGIWDFPEWYKSYSYPFKLNVAFELHLLVQLNSVTVFMNRELLYNLSTPLDATSVSSMRVGGTIQVHEVSV